MVKLAGLSEASFPKMLGIAMRRFFLGLMMIAALPLTTWAGEYEGRRYSRPDEQNPPPRYESAPPRYAIGEATDMVQRRTGGRVVGANPVNVQGRGSYRMKVLTPQGEVRILHVNPATGDLE